MQVANELQSWSGAKGQVHVTMSGAVINNVQSLNQWQNVPGYSNPNWGQSWANTYNALRTVGNQRTLDTIHFTGHHSMGPLVGNDYFLKDLIFQNATLAQPYFLGNNYVSSKGYFPTELGFSPFGALASWCAWSCSATIIRERSRILPMPVMSDQRHLTSCQSRRFSNTSTSAWSPTAYYEQRVVVNRSLCLHAALDPQRGCGHRGGDVVPASLSQNGSWLEG
jgi:hypothetical protein